MWATLGASEGNGLEEGSQRRTDGIPVSPRWRHLGLQAHYRCVVFVFAILLGCMLAVPVGAQQQPEDPEDDKQIGLWLDQGISTPLSPDKSLDVEFHERFDEGGANLYEYFVQGGIAFRLRP